MAQGTPAAPLSLERTSITWQPNPTTPRAPSPGIYHDQLPQHPYWRHQGEELLDEMCKKAVISLFKVAKSWT